MVLAIAASFVIPALAQDLLYKEEILGEAAFMGMGEMKFPAGQDTNIDMLSVGNDKALAFGSSWGGIAFDPKATNNLEIEKNQDSGTCDSCCDSDAALDNTSPCAICQDACTKVNIESIKVGDRTAMAFGFGTVATNNVKIVTNQI